MKVGDLVRLADRVSSDNTVGILVHEDYTDVEEHSSLQMVVVLWPDGTQQEFYKSWLEVI